MKTCTRCHETKPLDLFPVDRDKRRKNPGHKSECKACVNERAKAWAAANKERLQAYRVEYHQQNSERLSAKYKAWYEANADRKNEAVRAWHQENPDRSNAISSRRRAAKLQASPAWADQGAIRAVYAEAAAMRALGIDVHVDHIVPLQGELVSGLHVHQNLQLLLASDNMAKCNKYDITV
jgi:hypothetical protein